MNKMLVLAVAVFSCIALQAQETKPTLTATVIRIKHNAALIDDVVTTGIFSFSEPDKMNMVFDEGTDMLLMDGNSFTLVTEENTSVAKGKQASQLKLLQSVLTSILSGGDGDIDTHRSKEMEIIREENTIRITPINPNAKALRRMMFTSFTLTLDPASSALKSMCMNERGGNYTLYEFPFFVRNN